MIHDITNLGELQSFVKENDVVILSLSAPWCGACKQLAPVLAKITQQHGVEVVKLDIEEAPEVAAEHLVASVPTLVLYRDGKAVQTIVGAKPKAVIEQTFGLV